MFPRTIPTGRLPGGGTRHEDRPPEGGPGGPHLGMNAEFQARVDSVEVSGGPCTAQKGADLATLSAPVRARRWARKAVARKLFLGAKKSFERFLNCHRLRRRTPDGGEVSMVDLRRSKLSDALYYAGLQTCGSPWACPLCSAKISERRREEVQQAIDA